MLVRARSLEIVDQDSKRGPENLVENLKDK